MAAIVQFTIWVKHQGEADAQAWKERYHEETAHPRRWAKRLLKQFNATRRPDELKRVLVRVKVKRNHAWLPHDWHKTNAVTVEHGGSMFDTYRCRRCHATGKRFSMRRTVEPDRGYAHHCRNT